MKKQFFGSSLLELCQFFPTFSRKGWAKTRTLVKEMTCVLYSWKICWSGGCLISSMGKMPPKWPWRLGVLRSSSSRLLDWGLLFFKAIAMESMDMFKRKKTYTFFCFFPQMVQKTSHHLFFQKEGKPRKLILLIHIVALFASHLSSFVFVLFNIGHLFTTIFGCCTCAESFSTNKDRAGDTRTW